MMFDSDFYKTFGEMTRVLLGDVASELSNRAGPNAPVNLYESDDAYTVEAALPGFDPASIDVSVEDNVLTLTGERKRPEGIGEEQYSWSERSTGKVHRKVRFDRPIDRDGIEAVYENGLLVVTLPKAVEAKPRKIDIEIK